MRNIRVFVWFYFLFLFSQITWAQNKANDNDSWFINGFIDLRFQEGDLNSDSNGFAFYDGAIQITGFLQKDYSVFVDLPVGWQKGVDTDGDGKKDNFANSWSLGKERAQVILSLEKSSYKLLIGQFDSPIGFESNDSRDLYFAKHGLLFNEFTPTTHVGVKGEYKALPFLELHSIVSNPQGNGSYGGESPEYSLQVLFKKAEFYLLPGYYTRNVMNESIHLLNIYGGYNSKEFQLYLEFNQLENPDLKKPAKGYMLLCSWAINELWTAAMRWETAEQLELKVLPQNKSAQQLSVSAHYLVNPKLRLLADFTTLTYNPVLGDKQPGEESTLSLQQSF
ncbi:MAG: outer membrane beta-barrel protein [Bdellovibrionaceae bacterium]|nr:outer membrane beta-barrel protein [Pseudobdellovibrionaceae bacterium]